MFPPRFLPAAFALATLVFAFPAARSADLRPWTGGPAPVLELKDLAGANHKLEAYRGKVVVLNFWATWCEPCRDEMPSFNKLRQAFAGQPVMLLAVNVGEDAARIAEFTRKVPVEFPILLDRDARASREWKVRVMPTTFILGRDGRIRYTYAGGRDWADAAVRARVAELAAGKTGR
jgi:thiol-disulfide isomerase/thioredoxin